MTQKRLFVSTIILLLCTNEQFNYYLSRTRTNCTTSYLHHINIRYNVICTVGTYFDGTVVNFMFLRTTVKVLKLYILLFVSLKFRMYVTLSILTVLENLIKS